MSSFDNTHLGSETHDVLTPPSSQGNLKPANGTTTSDSTPLLQQARDTVSDHVSKTQNDFSALGSTVQNKQPGQPLTHYHSFFYELFTWQHPRASAIAFLTVLTITLATRYVNLLRYAFKGAYVAFGVTTLLEWIGRPITGQGFMTQVRPKRYYTIPRESLEAFFSELHELTNFFVLEFQQLAFAENIFNSAMAFVVTFIGYFLVKYLPVWGLFLTATTLLFITPLIYQQFQEEIDSAVNKGNDLVNHHATQARNAANNQFSAASERAKGLAGDLSNRVNAYRGKSASPPPPDTATTTGAQL